MQKIIKSYYEHSGGRGGVCVKEDQAGGLEPCKVLAVSVNTYINETSVTWQSTSKETGEEEREREKPKEGNKYGVGKGY